MVRDSRADIADARVYACLLHHDQTVPTYAPVRALEGVISKGRRVQVRIKDAWLGAVVVKPWEHGLGSVVCLEIQAPV